jgi:hypothetical protein
VLLATVASTIQNVDTDILNPVAISPLNVSGVFFVGVYLDQLPASFPASMDGSVPSNSRAWVTGASTASLWNPSNLNDSNHVGLFEMDSIGYPSVFLLRAQGAGQEPFVFCTAKVNSLGCTPAISFTGTSSASATSGFTVDCAQVINFKSGIVFYSLSGRASTPFQGGVLCMKAQIRRSPVQVSGGTPKPAKDCSGTYSLDMNAFAKGLAGGNPSAGLAVPGNRVVCQWWGRDQGFAPPMNTMLSDALQYEILP